VLGSGGEKIMQFGGKLTTAGKKKWEKTLPFGTSKRGQKGEKVVTRLKTSLRSVRFEVMSMAVEILNKKQRNGQITRRGKKQSLY